jgi:hypothetical protein
MPFSDRHMLLDPDQYFVKFFAKLLQRFAPVAHPALFFPG